MMQPLSNLPMTLPSLWLRGPSSGSCGMVCSQMNSIGTEQIAIALRHRGR